MITFIKAKKNFAILPDFESFQVVSQLERQKNSLKKNI